MVSRKPWGYFGTFMLSSMILKGTNFKTLVQRLSLSNFFSLFTLLLSILVWYFQRVFSFSPNSSSSLKISSSQSCLSLSTSSICKTTLLSPTRNHGFPATSTPPRLAASLTHHSPTHPIRLRQPPLLAPMAMSIAYSSTISSRSCRSFSLLL